MTEEENNALVVLAGQVLLVRLKGGSRAADLFRTKYLAHVQKMLGVASLDEIANVTADASAGFAELLCCRYGVRKESLVDLISLVRTSARAWVVDASEDDAVASLRVIDAWSGFASVIEKGPPCPLSLVDESLEILLPIVCAEEVGLAVESLWAVVADAVEDLEGVDAALEACVRKLVGGVELERREMNELKLIVLLHLPKGDDRLAACEGLVYSVLKEDFAEGEV